MFSPLAILLVVLATACNARTVSNGGAASLVDQVKEVVDALPMAGNADNTVSTKGGDGVYIPGRADICETLCPKWCQKINGTTTDNTNCHYLCGNICYDKTTAVNPFIGNGRYEVVPSDFAFSRYDADGDKLISVQEFARVEGVPADEVMDLFLFADANGDGHIDSQEFQGGPLIFTVQMAAELSAMALAETEKPTTQA